MSALPRVGGASLSRQVLDVILDAIRQGSFPDGRLPTEDRLSQDLGVSRTTVRRALQSLEQLGLIERRPGRGTRLRHHGNRELLALHGLLPFPTMLRELGYEVSTDVKWVRKADGDQGPSYEVRTVLHADGKPAVATLERFPDDDNLARAPGDEDFAAGSILILSARCFRDPVHHVVARIEPRTRCGRPHLLLDEVFYSADERVVATSEVTVDPCYLTFSVFRRFAVS
jgi:DNA-binding GntR family transcriptional regulator